MNYPVIPRTFFSGDCFDAYRILGGKILLSIVFLP